ncbi:LRP chaperone MESD [Galemys pyrenaicus]|uniref:LRP chaperone MESD n=1 Tax=Galemys pyrenaicus TaxID=202257 RepID=A0A8J6A8I9_GALPY|nr:LRP chaperone MESD [Galemys pyrenaicus]
MAASGWARAAVLLLCASELLLLPVGCAAEGPAGTPGEATPPPRKKKDIRDYNDADMARLLEQWEVRGAPGPSAPPPRSRTQAPLPAARPPAASRPGAGGFTFQRVVSALGLLPPQPPGLTSLFGVSPTHVRGRAHGLLSGISRLSPTAAGRVSGSAAFLPRQKDDDIEEGDLPEHKRPSAPIDFSQIDPGKPESILRVTKKGKTLMMFVTVSGSPTEKEMEEITSLWQGSLFNANYDVQRFIVGADRAIFMLRDGSYAWEIKDFLVGQDRCADVTLEGQVYPGRGAGKEKNRTKQQAVKDSRAGKGREEL